MISVGALEEAVLCLLCFNHEHAPALALRLTPQVFTSRTHQTIAVAALDYIQRYHQPPGGQLEYLLEAQFRRGEEGKLLAKTYDMMKQQVESIQPAFVLDQLDRFLASQRMTVNLERALESLMRGDLDEARTFVNQSQTIISPASKGIWLKDPKQSLAFMDQEDDDFFSTGIEVLDRAGVTPTRKTLSFMMASTGKGKSWWLVDVGKRGIQHHWKTLHVTLENSEEMTSRRYIQSIFSLTKKDTKEIKVPIFNSSEGSTSIDFHTILRGSVLSKRREIEARLKRMHSFPPLLIKEFATAQLSVETLDVYLDSLAREYGFIPDLIILDYADLMKIDSNQLRVDTGRLYRELRGLSVSRNAALVTATQGNRESDTAKTVDRRNVAEDWSKIGTADNVYTYSQTAEELKLGLARILVAKSRNERDRWMALISQAYEIGQFCLDSVLMQANVSQEVDRLTGGDV